MLQHTFSTWSLRRYTFIVTGTILLLFALVVCEGARQSNVRNYYKNFNENAEILTSTIEAASNYDLKVGNSFALKQIASRIVSSVPDVVAIVIRNTEGQILAAESEDIIAQSYENDSISTYQKDVYADFNKIGRITLGFDVSHQKSVLRNSAANIYLSGIAIIAICAMLILAMLNHAVVNPVRRIHRHLLLLQNNQHPEALSISANKELTHLGDTVNEFGNVLELRLQKEHELEEASRAKSDFLANMSHELRTPMNGVLGMLSLLRETQLNPEQSEQVRIATSSSKSLLTLINDILDFSKLEAGKLDYEKIEFNLEDLVEECAEALSDSAHSKGVDFICEIDKDIPVTTIGDPTRLRQVLTNLAGNAIKFTEKGVVKIQVSHCLNIASTDEIKFTVSDTGVGITEQAQQKLFKSFEQADTSTTRKFGGTGLGLAISRRLVEGMNGQIGVSSKVNKGSSFWFTLNLPAANNLNVLDANQINLNRELKILLVENNEASRTSLSRLLEEHCTQVHHAQGGDEALIKLAQANQDSQAYDIVFFSTQLSDMSARQFARNASTQPCRPSDKLENQTDLQLIAINTISQARTNLYTHTNNEITAHVSKPVRRVEIVNALGVALSPRSNMPNGLHATDEFHNEHEDCALHSDQASSSSNVDITTHSANTNDYHDVTILVAEDNLINQLVTQSMLENMGFTCVVADNGQHALDLLATETVDLILMDCQMPVLDGYKTTQQIRASETDTHLPIIALTANAMQGDAEKCYAAGMDSFLTKPIDKDLFEQAILETLKDRLIESKLHQSELNKAA